jgi:hypothetical protein
VSRPLQALRIATAVAVAGSAIAFTVGISAERSSRHHETAAEHAAETGAAPGPSTTAASSAPEGNAEHEPETASAEPTTDGAQSSAPGEHGSDGDAGDGTTSHEAAEHSASGEAAGGENEKLLGINVESTPVIVLADVIAALLIAALLWIPVGGLLILGILTVAFGFGAFGLDIREAIHQHREGHGGLLATAIVVAALHLLVAVLGAALVRRGNRVRSAVFRSA